ncbi:MAG TPA: hypothetical protein PKE62_18590, partial [Anaerolineales bacterium]|nr:hypothetical protein [Anaerolineales bacterium]
MHRRIEDRTVIDGDDLVTACGSETDTQNILLALPRMQRHPAAAGAVRVDQFIDLAIDSCMIECVDHELALPVP